MTNPEVDKTKERLFGEHALSRLTIAEQILGHSFAGIRKLFAEKGPVSASIHLLDVSHGSFRQGGFTLLAETDLLDYSIEQSVLDFAESGLFPNAILRSARVRLSVTRQRLKRLNDAGMSSGQNPASTAVSGPESRS